MRFVPTGGRSAAAGGGVIMSEKPGPASGRRILFVDDEPSIVRLAQVMLRSLGHTVTTFGKPADALAALKAEPGAFDLLITDLTMPETTGMDLARQVREVRPDLPIVLSSGYADEVPAATLKTLGIVEVLPKPFQAQALGAAIARATGNQ